MQSFAKQLSGVLVTLTLFGVTCYHPVTPHARGETMIVSGKEPQVGGLLFSDAPMLSSRYTRLMTRGRQAYLASDQSTLIELMDREQRLRFRHDIVRLAMHHAERVLALSPEYSPFSADDRHTLYDCMHAAYRWLEAPTAANQLTVYHAADRIGFAIRMPTATPHAFGTARSTGRQAVNATHKLAWCILGNIENAAVCAEEIASLADICTPSQGQGQHTARQAAQDWLTEAAWAALNHREGPLLEDASAPPRFD